MTDTPQQMHQGSPARQAQMGDNQPVKSHDHKTHLSVVADNSWRERESEMSMAIVKSESPILFITNKAAKSYGGMATYMADTFPNTPIVFESGQAQKEFRAEAGIARTYFDSMTIGVAHHDPSSKKDHPAFTSSDCIIVIGSPEKETRNALSGLKSENRSVFISETPTRMDERPQARVNFAEISQMNPTRTPQWAERVQQICRPSVM